MSGRESLEGKAVAADSGSVEPARTRKMVSDAVWFMVLFGLSNVLSYVYVVVAGHQLAAAEFGVFNALLGVLTLAGVVANAVQTAVTSIAAQVPTRASFAAVNKATARVAIPAVAVVTIAGLPLAHLIGAGPAEVVVCGLVTLAMLLAYPSIGFLLGLGMVWHQALAGLAGTLARLASGIPLMMVSGGVVAGLLGYLANYALVLVVALPLCWRRATLAGGATPKPGALRLDARTMATYIAVFVPFSLDQMMVQVVAPERGGAYAALSTMSKLVFFGAYPIVATAFPVLVRQVDLQGQLRVAGYALLGVVVVAGGSALAMMLFPGIAVGVFFGSRFGEAVPVLVPMAAGAFCFALSALGGHVLIAWGSRWAPAASLAPFVAGAALFAANHSSLGALVFNQCVVYGLQLALVGLLLIVEIAGRRASMPANGV